VDRRSSAVDRGGSSLISAGGAGVAPALGCETCAGVDADMGGARGVRNCGAINTPASTAAASVPNTAGRRHVRRPGARLEPTFVGALLAVRSSANRAAWSSTARRTDSLGRLGSRADTRR
jgi:hypothetical protein